MLTIGPTADESDIVEKHFNYLTNLSREGKSHLFGRTQNNDKHAIGLVILETRDIIEAREIMANDPAVINGVMGAALYPYQIAGGVLADTKGLLNE